MEHDAGPDRAAPRMTVQLITLPPVKVAYLRRTGAYGAPVGQFVREAFMPWMKAQGLEGRSWYGLPRDDPSITPAEKCRFDCCTGVPDDFLAHGAASLATLPGGLYAAGSFRGNSDAAVDAWTEMFRDWLPSSGMQCDARPFFDYFPENAYFDPGTGVFACSLCIPVCPL